MFFSMRLNLTLICTIAMTCTACAPYIAPMRYKNTQETAVRISATKPVTVGNFVDKRNQASDNGGRWFGLIRNGWGIPVKQLYAEEPIKDAVRDAFIQAITARGVDVNNENSEFKIQGSVISLECDAIFSYGATVNLQISVVSTVSNTNIYSNSYSAYKEQPGYGMAFYGVYVDMGKLTETTLSDVIDKFLDDPDFISALNFQPGESRAPSVSERLKTIEKLKTDGLISESEFKERRNIILNGL